MLVFIQEATNTILEKEINEYQGSGTIEWLHGQRINPKWRTSERNPNQMEYVIYHMRNAIAHCGICWIFSLRHFLWLPIISDSRNESHS